MIEAKVAHQDATYGQRKNRPAVFILSPPRSGTTLLRVLLGGHPSLFAPPELELLSFETLAERREAFQGRNRFWLEGVIRAVMEIDGCDADTARRIVEGYEREGLTTLELYRRLQDWIGDRILVDKTPSYALDPAILERAEEGFEGALYVHLIRNPYGMIRSFEEAKLDQIFIRQEHSFSRRELAELIWVVSHQNILEFLEKVPRERQHRLRFEDLLGDPEGEMRSLCGFLGLEFDPAMTRPYEDRRGRMTDGIHPQSRMLGDVKFHEHRGIDLQVAERWREGHEEDFLGDVTWELAVRFGYRRDPGGLGRIESGERRPGEPQPLSFAQERLWILDQLAPGSIAYNIPVAVRLRGPLDRAALRASLGEVVRRHEALRTTFDTAAGEPVQVIAPPGPFPLPVIDLRRLAAPQRAGELRRRIAEEAERPFDLRRGPLLRGALLELGGEGQALFLTMHHIVSDGWSMGILIRELGALYEAFSQGRPSPLTEPRLQYADFARWQRQRLSGETLDVELAYWREKLRDLPPLELPADRPRRALGGAPAERRPLALPAPLAEDLRALSRREGTTLFVTLLAVLVVLLQRHTGEDDVRLGSPVASRNRTELEDLVGFFANTLVLRSDCSGHPAFSELLGRVKRTVLEAQVHQELPFERVVSALQPERDLSRTPLFQVMFAMQNASAESLAFPGLAVELLPVDGARAKFDLTFTIGEGAAGLDGFAEYDRDLFDATTIGRLLAHLDVLAGAIAADPLWPVSSLPLLTAPERHALLCEQNDTAGPDRPPVSLHELFERQAARTPEAVAVIYGGERLGYRELDERANRLAWFLRRRGVGPEARVGVLLDRSAAMVAALLGVLKAGGAYVPLDRNYPPERTQLILRDAGVVLLLTRNELEEHAAEIAALPPSAPARTAGPRNLAYLIYTSGSTGRPKGVAIEHRSAVELVCWAGESFSREELAGVLAATSICFDLSVFEIFAPLAWGGTVVLAENALALPSLPAAAEVTLLNTVPSAMAALLSERLPPSLCTVCLAGEALRDALAGRIHAAGPALRLLNLYGPSEDTTYSTWVEVAPGEPVTIGRPLTATRAYVLDRWGEPMPAGAPGELCLAGAGLARGYLGRPDLTAERFVPDPFAVEPGGRLYRTGDRVRALPAGRLDFLGRLDHQIKLRGFRIELGEIEAALAACLGVREAAVALREDPAGRSSLGAYVTPADGAFLEIRELLDRLRERLPEPMIPVNFTRLAELPRLPNGKVDRRALPAPVRSGTEREATAPRTPAEELLAGIWREVLRLGEIDVHANFFELGGDSILGIQVASRAGRAGLRLPPRQLFEHPTVAGLAAVAGEAAGVRAAAEEPAAGSSAPLTPIQQWFFEQEPAERSHFNQSLLLEVVPDPGRRAEPALLRHTLVLLLAHHDALRLRFEPPAAGEPSWRQVDGGLPAEPRFLHVDLAALPEERRRTALEGAAARLQANHDLGAGALAAAALFTAGAGQDRLLLTIHHLVVDGVSWRILLEDFEIVYRQLARGEVPALPPRTTSFLRWARRLAEHAQSPAIQGQTDYWRGVSDPPLPRLPVDRTTGANDVASTRTVTVALGSETTRALLQEAPRAYRTRINDLLLTALAETFADWTGEGTLRLDLEGHGREELAADLDVSRTVGWFTTLFPVRLDRGAGAGPGEALKAVKERLRAIPDNGLGFGLLRGTLPAQPPSEVVFNYLGQLDGAVAEERLFRLAAESPGPLRHPRQLRAHLLDVTASVVGGRLEVSWTYSENRHARATVEALANGFVRSLEDLVAHCLSPDAGGLTPSDFPLAGIAQEDLDLLARTVAGEIEDLHPASPLQQGMLFHSLRAPRSGAYVGQTGLVIDLGGAAFERAWDQLVTRHPVLRTAFWHETEPPLAVVHRQASIPWERRDWRGRTEAEQRRAMAEYLEEDRRRGFDLARPPLLRLSLIRLSEERSWLLWSVHHALLDGWSMQVLLRDLLHFYEAALRGETPRLERVHPYREYIAWLLREDLAAAERYWRRTLAGFTEPTPLEGGRAATGAPAAEPVYGVETSVLSAAGSAAVQVFARRHQLTLNTVAQGTWGLLLHRYSGAEDVVFGAVTSGRSAPLRGIEEMVGLFINTLPVRVGISSAAAPPAWLAELQERQAEARQHEYSPLAEVQRWSDVPRGRPLFESLLVFENYPADESVREQIGGSLRASAVEVREQTNYPLTLAASGGSRVGLKLLFDAERFDAAAASRLLGHFAALLLGMAEGEDRPLGALPLLTAAEQRQLAAWSAGAAGRLPEVPVPRLFELQAAWAPERPALRFQGEELTYGELDSRANQVARYLRRQGVRPGAAVGLALERSLDLLVGLLGILKAGGAYVPLDPGYPRERLDFMIEDSGLEVLLAHERALAGLAGREGVRIVRLDAEREEIAREERSAPESGVGPGGLAYVIYTSGSTGRPKGVLVEHGNLAGVLQASLAEFGWEPSDHALCMAPFSFDIFLFEALSPLLAGALCTLVPLQAALDVDALAELLSGVTRLHAVPALMRQVLAAARTREGGLPALRTLFVGGDEVPLDLLAEMRRVVPAAEIRVLYGPTEGTIICAGSRVPAGEEPRRSTIGRPLPGAEIRLHDPQGRPVPAGVPGEIWIGGAGVTRGYLGRAELTAERYPTAGGRRFYRTGDAARWLPDGELEFLGRIDEQVKIRGFRVEPGEIEALLREDAAVAEAAVAARDGAGGRYLAAWIVPRAGAAASADELRAFLRARVPEPMVPAVFTTLAALPLSPHGKVDRRALSAPEAPSAAGHVPPQTPVETVLAAIWMKVLKAERVGSTDNFFDLGGHSLLATQIVSRVRRTFRIDLPLSAFFDATTVAGLAGLVLAHEVQPGLSDKIARALLAVKGQQQTRGGEL